MFIALLAQLAAGACQFNTASTDASHAQVVTTFVQKLSDRDFDGAAKLTTRAAEITDVFSDDDKPVPLRDLLAEASNARTKLAGKLRVVQQMTDGSNIIAARVASSGDPAVDDEEAIWIFNVGSDCIMSITKY